MAAKKATPKKAAPAKTKNSSAAAKRMADEKLTKTGKRTDKAGSRGMGMTKSAVEARAKDAGFMSMMGDAIGGSLEWSVDSKSGLMTSLGLNGGEGFKKGYEKRALDAANAVRKKYGVKPKKK